MLLMVIEKLSLLATMTAALLCCHWSD